MKYMVSIPITGVAVLEIEAENEEQAVDMAFEKVTIDDIEEWDAVGKIIQGNVFYGIMNEFNVEELK